MIKDQVKILKGLVALALSTTDKDNLHTMLKSIDHEFKSKLNKDGIVVSMIQPAQSFEDEDGSSECVSYVEFTADGNSVVVAIEGYWSSYDGYQYNQWYFCKPQPVTKVEYVKE